MGKLHREKVISARQKVAGPAPSPPPFEDHGIRKYKDADYAEKIEMDNYKHQIDKVRRATAAEREKQRKYEGASKAADEMIAKTKKRIAKEDAEAAEKKRREKARKAWLESWNSI